MTGFDEVFLYGAFGMEDKSCFQAGIHYFFTGLKAMS